jgi:hypothetical protein
MQDSDTIIFFWDSKKKLKINTILSIIRKGEIVTRNNQGETARSYFYGWHIHKRLPVKKIKTERRNF